MYSTYALAPKYSELFYSGFWFSPERGDALITGSLRVFERTRGTLFQRPTGTFRDTSEI
jgi:argininosuccinate synthase